MKVYVLTSGTYSDYHINGVFSSLERAEAYRKVWPCDDVEEWELDPHDKQVADGLFFFIVTMHADTGDVDECRRQPPREELRVCNDIVLVAGSVKEGVFVPGPYQQFRWWGWAKDEQHAIKIANEKRLIAIAQKG